MTERKIQLTFPTQAQESITQALVSMRDSIIEDNPYIADEIEEMDEVLGNMNHIVEMAIQIMSDHLSNEEIQFLNELYANPILLGILSKYPAMVKDAVKLGSELAAQDFIEQYF